MINVCRTKIATHHSSPPDAGNCRIELRGKYTHMLQIIIVFIHIDNCDHTYREEAWDLIVDRESPSDILGFPSGFLFDRSFDNKIRDANTTLTSVTANKNNTHKHTRRQIIQLSSHNFSSIGECKYNHTENILIDR
jgi:hypothetical protein